MGPPVEAEGLFRRLLGSAIARLGSPSTSPSAASLAGKGRAVDCEDGDCNVVPVHALRQLRQVRWTRERRDQGPGEKIFLKPCLGVTCRVLMVFILVFFGPAPFHCRQVARFVEVVLGWEGVEMAVGGSPEADKLDEMKQPTASSLLHMVRTGGGQDKGKEGGHRNGGRRYGGP